MNSRRFSVSLAAVTLLTAATSALAHHSKSAEFDNDKPLEFTNGIVKVVEWTSPHIHTQVEVKGADGKTVLYRVEAGAPNSTFRRGWRKESLPPGTIVSFKGIKARNPESLNVIGDLKLADGTLVWDGPGPEN